MHLDKGLLFEFLSISRLLNFILRNKIDIYSRSTGRPIAVAVIPFPEMSIWLISFPLSSLMVAL